MKSNFAKGIFFYIFSNQ